MNFSLNFQNFVIIFTKISQNFHKNDKILNNIINVNKKETTDKKPVARRTNNFFVKSIIIRTTIAEYCSLIG